MSFRKCPKCEKPLKAQTCPKHGFMTIDHMEGYEQGLEDGLSRKDTDRLGFDYLSEQILKYDAKSVYKQVAIVMLRSIFRDAEAERLRKE